jgi:hypothetical protein
MEGRNKTVRNSVRISGLWAEISTLGLSNT